MNRSQERDYWRLRQLTGTDTPQFDADLRLIHRHTTTLTRLATDLCNGYPKIEYRDGKRYEYSELTEQEQDYIEKKSDRLEESIRKVCQRRGWKVSFQGDPRGWIVKLEINGINASPLVNIG